MSDQNLFRLFRTRFPDDLNSPFLDHARGVMSFAELEEGSARIAAVLKFVGVGKGDRVIVQVAKTPEAVLLYLACLRVGAVFVPLNTAYTAQEIGYFIEDAAPKLVVCDPSRRKDTESLIGPGAQVLTLGRAGEGTLIEASAGMEAEMAVAPCEADDLAAILYTSGTTGRSKGAMLSHRNLSSNALTLHEIWQWRPGDVLLHALPIFHVHGLFVALHCALLNGSRVIFQSGFDVGEVVARLPEASVMMGVPTYYTRLLDHPGFGRDSCAGMRLFLSGSAPLLPETFARFEERTGHRILERYGMTEAGMITSNPYDGERLPGTVGYPLPGVRARVAGVDGSEVPHGEVGILEIAGPNVFQGYWQMPEKTAQEFRGDGFFVTGDMAAMEVDGRVSIVGRAKDLVISGGYNVYPKEVEIAIDKIAGVRESAVIGVPHPDFGEAVVAIVVADENGAPSAEGIAKELGPVLARFKQPKAVMFLPELPRNTMGKVQKNKLRESYATLFAKG